MAAFSDWGKREFGTKEIYGIVDSKNYASIKVLENAGFYVQDSSCICLMRRIRVRAGEVISLDELKNE